MNKKNFIILLLVSSMVVIVLFLGIFSSFAKLSSGSYASSGFFDNAEVGILEIEGVLMDSTSLLDRIKKLKNRKTVKTVVVRINSPGGAMSPSQEVYEELKKLDKEKPVIASLSTVAASGGYYIACAARTIICNAGSITGSIGVIMQLTYLEKLYEFIKVTPVTIKSGKFKDIGSSARVMTNEEKDFLQKLSDNMHDQFKRAVSESRRIPMNVLEKIADGRIFSGEQAHSLGLVDYLGTYEDAINYAANIASIKGTPSLFNVKEPKSSLKDLFSEVKTLINSTLFENIFSFYLLR